MATKTAPDRRHETLREKETGAIRTGVHPVDAKEMIASGAYEHVPAGEDTSAPAGAAPAASSEASDDPAETELPTVAKLPGVLATMDSVDAIIAMSLRDPRATAQPLYEARLKELEPPTS